MSLRSNGAGDNLQYNEAIAFGTGAFSSSCWVKLIADRNTFSNWFGFTNAAPGGAASERINCSSGGDGTTPRLAGNQITPTDMSGFTMTAGTWYYVVLLRSGDNHILNIYDDSTSTTPVGTLTLGLPAAYNYGSSLTFFWVGQFFTGEWPDAEFASAKVHVGVAWSNAQARAESQSLEIETAGGTAWGAWSLADTSTGLNDLTGNGRTLTNTGLVNGASSPAQLAGDVTEVSDADTAGFDEATTESADSSPRDDASFAEATTATAETTTPVDTGSVVEATAQTARATSPYDSGALVDTAEVGVSDIVHERTESAPLTDRVTQRYDQERDDTAALLDESDALTIFDRSPLSVLLDRVSQRVDWVLSDTMGVEEVADRFAPVELTASDTAGWAATTSQQADEDPIEDFPGVEATSESVTITTPIDELLGFNDFGEQGLGGDRQDAETFGWGDSASLAVVLAETDTMIATQVATRTGTAILHGTLDADAAMAPRLTGTVTLEV
jgi:hypothetical protein